MTMTIKAEYSDFGVPVSIQTPDRLQVITEHEWAEFLCRPENYGPGCPTLLSSFGTTALTTVGGPVRL